MVNSFGLLVVMIIYVKLGGCLKTSKHLMTSLKTTEKSQNFCDTGRIIFFIVISGICILFVLERNF